MASSESDIMIHYERIRGEYVRYKPSGRRKILDHPQKQKQRNQNII